ncbi:flagellar hook-basal body complex protein FliE [Caballeronia telluris]|uniref:Flagellar hook-basal body complex protein FliE n=1 Tax=Caballeronia telluris TaxID=326475 RepID=A0A158ESX6_9BURK|nr:flagellar hook-basal body complex protein FliE [Caballeronia telluris]SAL10702.1 flagellar hook-basal body protein FliE [Caballeronia telluris]
MNIESIALIDAPRLSSPWNNGPIATTQDFGGLLMRGVEGVDHAVQASEAAVTGFAIGDDMPPHQVMLALEDARLQLQFALQVRAKIVEGYQELMRMQI